MLYSFYCEKYCSCNKFCPNNFSGCQCIDDCNSSESCPCLKENRECNQDTCQQCFKKNQTKQCMNIDITLGRSKKTAVSKSLLCDGFGLFALEPIKKNEFICEYKGELISKRESDRRTVIDGELGINYLFTLNKSTDIDAYRIGNEMRYVCHSSYGYENCTITAKLIRGQTRIGLFAKRDIKALEELYFDYKLNTNVSWLEDYKRYYKHLNNDK